MKKILSTLTLALTTLVFTGCIGSFSKVQTKSISEMDKLIKQAIETRNEIASEDVTPLSLDNNCLVKLPIRVTNMHTKEVNTSVVLATIDAVKDINLSVVETNLTGKINTGVSCNTQTIESVNLATKGMSIPKRHRDLLKLAVLGDTAAIISILKDMSKPAKVYYKTKSVIKYKNIVKTKNIKVPILIRKPKFTASTFGTLTTTQKIDALSEYVVELLGDMKKYNK